MSLLLQLTSEQHPKFGSQCHTQDTNDGNPNADFRAQDIEQHFRAVDGS